MMATRDQSTAVIRQRVRVLQLLNAAERAGIAPVRTAHLHAFAYLADVLSPVWDLLPFEGKILKVEGGPHYPDLQREVDRLAALGLVQVSGIRYSKRLAGGVRMDASYALNFSAKELKVLLAAIGAGNEKDALDARDCRLNSFLVDLAGALSRVRGKELEPAAQADATYSDERTGVSNIVDFGDWAKDSIDANLSVRATNRFSKFLPEGVSLKRGEKLYLYAEYLGRRIHAR